MKAMKLLMIIILISIFSIAHAQTWEGIDHYLYYGDTGKDISVAWANPKVITPEDPFDDYNPLTDVFELIIYNKDSCLLYTSPSPRDATLSRMPSSA